MKTATLKTKVTLILSAFCLLAFLTNAVTANLLSPEQTADSAIASASASCDPGGPGEPGPPGSGSQCLDPNTNPEMLCGLQDWFPATPSGCIPSDDLCYPSRQACEEAHGAGGCRTNLCPPLS